MKPPVVATLVDMPLPLPAPPVDKSTDNSSTAFPANVVRDTSPVQGTVAFPDWTDLDASRGFGGLHLGATTAEVGAKGVAGAVSLDALPRAEEYDGSVTYLCLTQGYNATMGGQPFSYATLYFKDGKLFRIAWRALPGYFPKSRLQSFATMLQKKFGFTWQGAQGRRWGRIEGQNIALAIEARDAVEVDLVLKDAPRFDGQSW